MKPEDRYAEATLTRLRELLEPRSEIIEAYLFGSTARNQAQPHSDLDVAVFIDEAAAEPGGFGYQATLSADLMAALGTNSVDVVILNQAPPLLYHRVLSDGIRIVSRNLRATTTREARALSRYCDFVPQLDKIDAASRTTSPSKVTEP
ncbi:MAG: nucleotidyltransferase domain-containing protein [Thermoanaerobaculales bacterium]|jgi:predicted nucleotidyltransferase|nr:nucleotidyltransferase domain-containing protein [Thermoanaerobaculales bacterium]